jgi:hypothetical protein
MYMYASGEGHLPLFVGLRDNAAISDGGLYDGGDSGEAVQAQSGLES